MSKPLTHSLIDSQRQYDLVRQMRMELHNVDLITDEEYSELAQEHSAVARLESYDEVRQQIDALQREVAALRGALKDSIIAMCDFEARALGHHRHREPLSVALDIRVMIDKILEALRSGEAIDAARANSGDGKEDK